MNQDSSRGRRLDVVRGVASAVGLVSIAFIVQLARTVLLRLRYPFELEWMEGAIVDHVRIVLSGQPLYREPSVEFTPFIYTPLYYWVSAIFSRLVGIGFFAPRLVSTLSTIGSMAVIATLVKREGAGRLAMVVAVGLFAATYEISGFWMDLARVDSLFLFFFLSGALLARHGRTAASAVGCGALLFCSFFTKQTALTLALPVLMGAIALDRRRGALAAGTFALLCVAGVVWMNRTTNGWFGYYVFEVPRRHDVRWGEWFTLLIFPFWRPIVVPLLLGALVLVSGSFSTDRRWPVPWLYAGALAVALIVSYSSMMHSDGFANVLLPYYALVSVLGGIGTGWVLRDGDGTPLARRWQTFVMIALLVHFGNLAWDHRRPVPQRRDIEAGRALLAKLEAHPGPMLMLGTGYYASLARHPDIQAHTMALTDIFKTHDPTHTDPLLAALMSAVSSGRYATVVLDESYGWLPPEVLATVRKHYRREQDLFSPADAALAMPKTGFISHPQTLWSLKSP
jgi:hypothetical protein